MEFGKNMHDFRLRKNLSQAELAKMVEVSAASVSAYENGTKMPPLDTAVRISQALNTSLDALIGNPPRKADPNHFYQGDIALAIRILFDSHALQDIEYLDNKMRIQANLPINIFGQEYSDFMKGFYQLHMLREQHLVDDDVYFFWFFRQLDILNKLSGDGAMRAGQPVPPFDPLAFS